MSSTTQAAANKRKRLTGGSTTSLPDEVAAAERAQISESRDASAEEGDTTAAETPATAPTSHPPIKRQRSSNNAVGDATVDLGEPSDTTEASVDIENRVGRKGRKSSNPEKEEESMAPPPIGKLTHPVGYRTNDPPVGRPVRIYADGVFDLFHLGYVLGAIQRSQIFTQG